MRLRLIGFAFLVMFFLLAIVIIWPASTLSPWLERASNNHWRLASAEGSIWSGSGMLMAHSDNNDAWRIVKSISWKIRWGDLWRGRIGVAAMLDQGSSLFSVKAEGFSIEQLDASIPAPAILVLLPGALGRYGWGGNLHLRSSNFRCAWQTFACGGEIDLVWNDAEVAEIPGKKLGNYRFRLVGESQALRIDLTTLSGRLQFSGSGEIAARGLRFKGEAAATGPNAATLGAMLNTLGRRSRTPGKYLIDYHEAGAGH